MVGSPIVGGNSLFGGRTIHFVGSRIPPLDNNPPLNCSGQLGKEIASLEKTSKQFPLRDTVCSGRSFLSWKVKFPTNTVGTFDLELVREFFNAFSTHSGATIHVEMLDGFNSHHISEAIFKGAGKAIKMAVEKNQSLNTIPSTKGTI